MGRREITSALTLVVLVGVLVAGAWYGWTSLTSGEPTASGSEPTNSASAGPGCRTEKVRKGATVRAKQVTVSVYNAGSREGLASEVLAKLERRGFKGATADNAPAGTDVDDVVVRTVVKHDIEARLVARQFGIRVNVVPKSEDLGDGIDVIVGEDFKRLKKRAPDSLTTGRRSSTCEGG